MQKTIFRYPLTVENKGWIIFLFFVFFPIGFLLLMLNLRIHINDSLYYLKYKGSFGWLVFWLIIFFPIAVILFALNGADVEVICV